MGLLTKTINVLRLLVVQDSDWTNHKILYQPVARKVYLNHPKIKHSLFVDYPQHDIF